MPNLKYNYLGVQGVIVKRKRTKLPCWHNVGVLLLWCGAGFGVLAFLFSSWWPTLVGKIIRTCISLSFFQHYYYYSSGMELLCLNMLFLYFQLCPFLFSLYPFYLARFLMFVPESLLRLIAWFLSYTFVYQCGKADSSQLLQ